MLPNKPKYNIITMKFYKEILDLVVDDIAKGEIAFTRIERSQVNAPEMVRAMKTLMRVLGPSHMG